MLVSMIKMAKGKTCKGDINTHNFGIHTIMFTKNLYVTA